MTKRLYYDCAIQALYMIKNFGVNCDLDNLDLSGKKDGELIALSELMKLDKIYIAKESESIFEPKQGDRTIYGDSFYKNLVTLKLEKIRANGIRNNWTKERENEIVIRDNKHFFHPKTTRGIEYGI